MATADISAREEEPLVDSSSGSTSVTIVEKQDFSVDDAVESLGCGAFHLLFVLFCGMGTVHTCIELNNKKCIVLIG